MDETAVARSLVFRRSGAPPSDDEALGSLLAAREALEREPAEVELGLLAARFVGTPRGNDDYKSPTDAELDRQLEKIDGEGRQ